MKKKCSKCGQYLDLDNFCKDNRRKDGRGSHCKKCRMSYYTPRPWTSKQLKPDDDKTCTRCHKTKKAKQFSHRKDGRTGYHSWCKDCQRDASQNWKKNNPERIRQYRIDNAEKLKKQSQRWWKENRDKAARYSKKYYSSDRGILYNRSSAAKRRTADKNGTVTVEFLDNLFSEQRYCSYCKAPFSDSLKPTIDHIIPLSKGGEHTTTNVTLACQPCNSSKGNRII